MLPSMLVRFPRHNIVILFAMATSVFGLKELGASGKTVCDTLMAVSDAVCTTEIDT